MSAGESDVALTQKRGKTKASFGFRRDELDYRFEDGEGSGVGRKIDWRTLAPPTDYVSSVEGDGALAWVLTVLPVIAIFGALRGSPQPMALGLAVATTLVLVAGLWATSRYRRKAHTEVASPEQTVVVLAGRDHDAILAALGERRAAAISAAAEPEEGETIRDRLRRLRWLTEHEAMPRADYEAERHRLLGSDAARETPASDLDIRQTGLGHRIRFGFRADYFEYELWSLFDGGSTVRIPYLRLPAPRDDIHVQRDLRLALAIGAWLGAVILACMSAIAQAHPADYYVGGAGLPRALGDFGPPLLLMIIGITLIDLWTRRRYAVPYTGVFVLRDRSAERVLEEIEGRRIAAMRRLAQPDPLLYPDERDDMLDALVAEGSLSQAERDEALRRGASAAGDPALDQPAEAPKRAKERTLH